MRMANLRSPKIGTSATPGIVCRRGLTMRLMMSVISSGLMVSLVKASQTTGKASASTLATTDSPAESGSRARTRATRSRTSAAAASGSLLSLKRTVIWLCSEREIEVRMSTPSMPAMESSSGLVTCDSITSDEAPTSLVLTVTTGSSIRGYSRTLSLVYDTAPTSNSISDITVANTGRRMEISDSFMALAPFFQASGGARCGAGGWPRSRGCHCGRWRSGRRGSRA